MKLLVAEDNVMYASVLKQNAAAWGYQVVMVANGEDALSELQSQSDIRLAVLDWQMPKMSGIDVCRRIKRDASRPFTYVAMLTSRDAKEDIVTGLEAGADDYVTKPVEMAVLQSKLRAAKRIVEAVPPPQWTKPKIDGYEIEQLLGRGAFASVWRGTQLSTGRPVALKIIRMDLATKVVFERFAREVEAMGRLHHPHIADIYDSHIDAEIGYYAMELVEGGDLANHLRNRRVDAVDRIRLTAEICRGLAHAHREGIVHRDLKFANVMVTEESHARIVDFGMCKSMFQSVPTDGYETIEGSILGTPMFMSPEQARGEVAAIDHRTDLYAVGIMLYIMLLKRHPHDVDRGDREATVKKIAAGDVVNPLDHKANFNPRLAYILLKTLAKDPANRFASGDELAATLENFLAKRKEDRR